VPVRLEEGRRRDARGEAVSAFAQPFAIHVERRCRCCTFRVRITLLNGADAPSEGFYTCPWCLTSRERASDEVFEREQRPQLQLIEGGAGG
jgi:hypothetical protein